MSLAQGYRLEIEPSAPFRLDLTVQALRRRAHNRVDRWDESIYKRVLSVDDREPVALSVAQCGRPKAPRLSVRLSRPTHGTADLPARRALTRLLGLDVDLSAFADMAAGDPLLGPLAARMRGLRPPRFPTVFEALVNGIACQQLSLTVGIHLLNRLTDTYGQALSEDPAGPRAFPRPEALATNHPDELKPHGFSYAKARAIVELSRLTAAGDLDLEELEQLDDPAAVKRLTAVRGIGRWTAEYALLRGLGRLHVFPADDVGAQNKLRRLFDIDGAPDYDAVKRLLARWEPYAGVVYFHLLLAQEHGAGPKDFPSDGRKTTTPGGR